MKIVLFLTLSFLSLANDNIKKIDWDGLEVVWLKDDSVPTFSVKAYFADGALTDHESRAGETDMMFNQLFSGTNRYTQKQIHDNLEYFGVGYGSNVFHEYSTFSFSGLAKDIVPVTKKICHLFQDSIFPKTELRNEVKRVRSYLANLESNHSSLANHVFRKLSMRGTDFASPISGTRASLNRIRSLHLQRKLNYFNTQVKKRLYLRGSKEVLKIKEIIQGECKWDAAQKFTREVNSKQQTKPLKTRIVLFPVKGANQAQIRMGKFLRPENIQEPDLQSLFSGYLGGGFTSLLNHELRTKRGLTYSVNAISSAQKYYGRSILITFSKNETLPDTVKLLKDLFSRDKKLVEEERLKNTVQYLKGSHLFQFESNDSFLTNLLFFDHTGRSWDSLYNFPKTIEDFSSEQIESAIKDSFLWDEMVVVIVGSKSLLKELKKIDSIQTLNFKSYL